MQCDADPDSLAGVRFDGASGSITGVHILSLNQGPNGCQEGYGIDVLSAPFDGTHPDTKRVLVAGNTVRDYQKSAVSAFGDVQLTLRGNALGASATQADLTANTVVYQAGALGTVSDNLIAGNQNLIPGGADGTTGTAVILFDAPGVRVSNNAIRGNANVGVYVEGSPRTTVASNQVSDDTVDGGVVAEDTGIFVADNSVAGSSVRRNTIRCYDVPVEIEGRNPGALGPNTIQRCRQPATAAAPAATTAQRSTAAAVATGGPSVVRRQR